jgi:hypothetical protein
MKKIKYRKIYFGKFSSSLSEDQIINYCENNNVELISIFDDHFLVKEELVKVLVDYIKVGYDIKTKNILSDSSLSKYLLNGFEFVSITDESKNQNCANYYEVHLAKYEYMDKDEYNKKLQKNIEKEQKEKRYNRRLF